MVVVEVEKAPPYIALSYTWGDKMLSRTVTVDGCGTRITVNLAEAIDAIYQFARSRRLMFWADSICIDQNNLQERSKQVALMNSIYRSAELVTIWLGAAADDSDIAFTRMREWGSRFHSLKEEHNGSDGLAVTSIPIDDPFFFGPSEQPALKAIDMICRRPWWSRAWIVQEGSVASPERTLLFCGTQMATWTCWRAALHITHHIVHFKSSGMSVDFDVGMPIRLDSFREDRETGANIQLFDVLELLRTYHCEDPRDKIYAGLGMAMDVQENDFIPDYEKSYREVCLDVAKFFLGKSDHHALDFLGAVFRGTPGTTFEGVPNTHQLPSWVPDWTYRIGTHALSKNLDLNSFDTHMKVYNASGTLPVTHCIDDGLLCLQGAIIDKVSRVSRACEWNLRAGGLKVEKTWFPDDPDQPYVGGGTIMEAFNHTIMCDVAREDDIEDELLSRDCQADWNTLSSDITNLTPYQRHRQNVMMIDVKAMTFGRRLFSTSRGYIGLGPATLAIGDEVCLFSGGQVLYAVRKASEDRFEFMGECYVHGLMDGEACSDESFALRDIVLK